MHKDYSKINPHDYMSLHESKLHDDYHNFKTHFKEVIHNNGDPNGLFVKSRELIETIQACATNAHKYAKSRKSKIAMDTPGVIVCKHRVGDLLQRQV
jgi:hypothetical protein